MHNFCGLDFGTSNSTIGVMHNNKHQLVPLDQGKPTLRSAIFCDVEQKKWVFGQEGIDLYLESFPGRLLMSLKSVLGTSLMNDKTLIFNDYVSYADILGHFVKHLKTQAECLVGHELTQVVLGRPVHFHDHDPQKDKVAQNTLEVMAKNLGFKDVLFQYEPIAAALAYEASIQEEQLALIIDMGGGTSDFTIIRLHPSKTAVNRSQDVLANCGIHIAGTDFDKKMNLHSVMPLLGLGSLITGSSSDLEMPSSFYHELTTWHTLNTLYDPKTVANVRSIQAVAHEKNLIERLLCVLRKRTGHHILNSVEMGKQRLSDLFQTDFSLDFIEQDLNVTLSRATLDFIIDELLQDILQTVHTTVNSAGVKYGDINAIFYTGGSTKIPIIREKINALFKAAKVVQGDAFGSVGLGLTIDAQRRFSA